MINYNLKNHKVHSTFKPFNTIQSSLRSVKDPVDPKNMKSVYIIPFSCGTPYVGEIDHSIKQRIQEHATDIKHGRTHFSNIKHGRTHSSTSAEHTKKRKHHIYIEDLRVTAKIDHFLQPKFRETIEIEKRPSNLKVLGSLPFLLKCIYIYIYIIY